MLHLVCGRVRDCLFETVCVTSTRIRVPDSHRDEFQQTGVSVIGGTHDASPSGQHGHTSPALGPTVHGIFTPVLQRGLSSG